MPGFSFYIWRQSQIPPLLTISKSNYSPLKTPQIDAIKPKFNIEVSSDQRFELLTGNLTRLRAYQMHPAIHSMSLNAADELPQLN